MMNPYMQETENALVHTYNRFPVIFEKGEGVYLYDTEGKKYLDFAAGIAVCGLGYGNPELMQLLKNRQNFYGILPTCFIMLPAGPRQRPLRRLPVWTGYSLPTAGRRPMKEC